MADVIKMEYADMEEMSRTFQQGSQQLQQTMQEMRAISAALEGGALLGRGGSTFTEAIKSRLVTSIGKLDRKFIELQGDVKKAMNDMKRADAESKSKF